MVNVKSFVDNMFSVKARSPALLVTGATGVGCRRPLQGLRLCRRSVWCS